MSNAREVYTYNGAEYHMAFSRYPETHQIAILLVPVGASIDDGYIEATGSYSDIPVDINKEAVIAGNPPGLLPVLNQHNMIHKELKLIMATPRDNPEAGSELITVVELNRCPIAKYYECAHCGCANDHMAVCSGCRLLHYCCKDHQRQDWKKHHRDECTTYQAEDNRKLGIMDVVPMDDDDVN